MSEYGPLVVFRSIPELWTIERNGNKPNTVRLLTPQEYSERLDFPRACIEVGEPATIGIVNTAKPADIFFRRITSIEQIGTILGQTMWVISWRHEDGPGTYIDPRGGNQPMSDTRKTEERPLPEQLKAHAEACAEADCIVNRNQYCHFGPADSCPEVAAHYLTLTARLEALEAEHEALLDEHDAFVLFSRCPDQTHRRHHKGHHEFADVLVRKRRAAHDNAERVMNGE